ncbi:hypothetical protein Tsubulata_004729 [Turnera subulata]|uniref:Morc S5 domain-containing protein n=1 Tax=Turnera subulata TaxID=218843 RepID=A0A9Q0J814_9ROSI|nr:hypothetical protein Tsubulata_004729 [Turnera subulata]
MKRQNSVLDKMAVGQDIIDVCSDADSDSGVSGAQSGKSAKRKREFTGKESEGNGSSNVTARSNSSNSCQGGDALVDETGQQSRTFPSPAPVCRQFWKAGNYETGLGETPKAAKRNGDKGHILVHPMFLHSNATSHKWAFGAIAELLDNAVDEARNNATFVHVDKISNPRDRSPALLIQDDGGGMDPGTMRRCMSFGFSNKDKSAIGQYGNGFKTSTIRLGADVIVFSRQETTGRPTQSIGLLSYTFLRQMGHDKIVVPMLDYEFDAPTRAWKPILHHDKGHFDLNMSTLLQWCPYSTEDELLKQFDDVKDHGTKIVIFNLWLDDDGNPELDFDSDAEDIRVHMNWKLFQPGDIRIPAFDKHIAYEFQYSLRAYMSILYLKPPPSFTIKLRGQMIKQHNIVRRLKFPEIIKYEPHTVGNEEVITTIGFLKEAPEINVHGFNIYHRNRLILPFWRALHTTNSKGRGVVGVLEVNYIEPTHNKQDFEKTSLFQKLENRLKQMTTEYWLVKLRNLVLQHLHCELIGYSNEKSHCTVTSQELPSGRTSSVKQCLPVDHSSDVIQNWGPALSEDWVSMGTAANFPGGTPIVTPQMGKVRSRGLPMMRNVVYHPVELDEAEAHAADTLQHMGDQLFYPSCVGCLVDVRTEIQVHDSRLSTLLQQNKKLRLRCETGACVNVHFCSHLAVKVGESRARFETKGACLCHSYFSCNLTVLVVYTTGLEYQSQTFGILCLVLRSICHQKLQYFGQELSHTIITSISLIKGYVFVKGHEKASLQASLWEELKLIHCTTHYEKYITETILVALLADEVKEAKTEYDMLLAESRLMEDQRLRKK